MRILKPENRIRVKYIIDLLHKWNFEYEGREIATVYPDEEMDYGIDVIIMSTFRFRLDYWLDLNECIPEIEVIDPYDILEAKGFYFTQDFFLYATTLHKKITYWDIISLNKRYSVSNCYEEKRRLLTKLVAYLIEIRDFVTARRRIEELINNGMDTDSLYEGFLRSLDDFFDEISRLQMNRQSERIMMHWIDCVGADEFSETSFYKERLDDSLVFSKAYTPCPWTHMVTNLILGNGMPISDKAYKNNKFSSNHSKLLHLLCTNGYKFTYYANPNQYQDYFEDKAYVPAFPEHLKQIPFGNKHAAECASRLYWLALCESMRTDNSICQFVHIMTETHLPYYTSMCKTYRNDDHLDRRSSLEFIGEQLSFYKKLWPQNTLHLYFSDHTNVVERIYAEKRSHVVLIANKGAYLKGISNKLIGLDIIPAIIKLNIDKTYDGLDSIYSDYIRYETVDYMNKNTMVDYLILPQMKKKKFEWMYCIQCRAVRTEKDIFACYPNGREAYYVLPDEDNNLIQESKYKERINELRQLCGNEFIDMDTEREFTDSHYLWDYISLLGEDNIKW
ncbi:hypothetical protein [Butyrivibrio sp. AD3002]|uniref:hypothetical protein n=1 Tax=Butyrivibrio sp. AD3002 TaxID=1280670 RepID=UPI0003B3E86E|nr:hypothetical protein [Butyrivibrio sp. AD3002]